VEGSTGNPSSSLKGRAPFIALKGRVAWACYSPFLVAPGRSDSENRRQCNTSAGRRDPGWGVKAFDRSEEEEVDRKEEIVTSDNHWRGADCGRVVNELAVGCQPLCCYLRGHHSSTLMKLQVQWPGRIVRLGRGVEPRFSPS